EARARGPRRPGIPEEHPPRAQGQLRGIRRERPVARGGSVPPREDPRDGRRPAARLRGLAPRARSVPGRGGPVHRRRAHRRRVEGAQVPGAWRRRPRHGGRVRGPGIFQGGGGPTRAGSVLRREEELERLGREVTRSSAELKKTLAHAETLREGRAQAQTALEEANRELREFEEAQRG